jgi:uridine kinase
MTVTVLKEKNFLIPIEGNERNQDPEELLLSHDFDNYEAIDWPLFEKSVDSLRNRIPVATPIYDIFDNKRLLKNKEL